MMVQEPRAFVPDGPVILRGHQMYVPTRDQTEAQRIADDFLRISGMHGGPNMVVWDTEQLSPDHYEIVEYDWPDQDGCRVGARLARGEHSLPGMILEISRPEWEARGSYESAAASSEYADHIRESESGEPGVEDEAGMLDAVADSHQDRGDWYVNDFETVQAMRLGGLGFADPSAAVEQPGSPPPEAGPQTPGDGSEREQGPGIE